MRAALLRCLKGIKSRQAVEGLIVARETDDQLRYAASAMPGVQVVTYEVKFALQPVHIPVGA